MPPTPTHAALRVGMIVLALAVVACGQAGPPTRPGIPPSPTAVAVAGSPDREVAGPRPPGSVELLWQADSAPDPLRWPTGLALDGHGGLIVVDAGHHQIRRFDGGGRPLARWGVVGDGPGQFRFWRPAPDREVPVENGPPSGAMAASGLRLGGNLAVAPGGDLLVADILNHRIQRFDAGGQVVAAWGGFGHDQGQFREPSGLAVDRHGQVYVADTGNHRIQQFDGAGAFRRSWGREGADAGAFQYPVAVVVDVQDQVYVADSLNHRIQKFTSDGRFLAQWGRAGDGPGELAGAACLAVDGDGRVYVADTLNHRVQVFDGAGAFVAQWADLGSGAGEFIYPGGIAVDGRGDVYVADIGNGRIQAFRPRGPWPAGRVAPTPQPPTPTPILPLPPVRLTAVDH